jgi:hypothetical protein
MASATSSAERRVRFMASSAKYGAGELIDGPAGPLAFQCPHGFSEFFQPEGAGRVIEQSQLGARWR